MMISTEKKNNTMSPNTTIKIKHKMTNKLISQTITTTTANTKAKVLK